MFKYIHKVSSYGDESRVDFNLNKRPRNYRFKNKIIYLEDKTVFYHQDISYLYRKQYCNLWYKFYNYIINADFFRKHYKNIILYRKYDKPALINQYGSKYWYINGKCNRRGGKPCYIGYTGCKTYCNNEGKYIISHPKLQLS